MPPRDYGPAITATAFTLTSVSTVVVSLRLYCNRFLINRAGISDVFMISALIVTWGVTVNNFYQVKYGSGKHFLDQTWTWTTLEGTDKSWYSYQLIYLVALALIKFSILSFYTIISDKRWYRIAIYTMMAIVGIFTTIMVFVNAFECPNPSDAFNWQILLYGYGHCHDLHEVYFGQAGFNIGSDVIIIGLPFPILAKLQMKRARRVALFGIFAVGIISILASILRLWALTLWAATWDTPYAGGPILLFTQVELNAAMISASFPALKALVTHTLHNHHFFGSSNKEHDSNPARYFKYSYGAKVTSNPENPNNNQPRDPHPTHTNILLKSLSSLRSPGPTLLSSSYAKHDHPTFEPDGNSDEAVFLDEPDQDRSPKSELAGGRASSSTSQPSIRISRDEDASADETRDGQGGARGGGAAGCPGARWARAAADGIRDPRLEPVYGAHKGIMKSVSVQQTSSGGVGGARVPQYYRAHYLR